MGKICCIYAVANHTTTANISKCDCDILHIKNGATEKINHSSYNSHFNRLAYTTVFNNIICMANALLRQIPQHFEVNSAANSSTHMQYT